MRQLGVLKIRCCNNVSSVKFSGLKGLDDLREVLLSGSYDDNLKQHMQKELNDHPRENKPVLKEKPAGSSWWALSGWARDSHRLYHPIDVISRITQSYSCSFPSHSTLPSLLNPISTCAKEFQYKEIRFRGSFRRLWVLEIDCNSRLQSVTFQHHSVMQHLEVLKIRCSNVSSLEFHGLHHLSKLREVSLSKSCDEKVKNGLKRQLDKHRREIKPDLKWI